MERGKVVDGNAEGSEGEEGAGAGGLGEAEKLVAETAGRNVGEGDGAVVADLDTGACDPTVVSDSLDLWGLNYDYGRTPALSNLDFAVAARGFCMELSPWGDEVPNDDPTQPLGTDLNTYKTILNACNQQTRQTAMIKFCGFPFFPYKYSSEVGGKHEPVMLEWETAWLITAYNAYMEVFWTYNTSFYAALRPVMAERHFVQNPPPTYNQMVSRGLINAGGQVVPGNYILLNLGDYDCVSWTINDVGGHFLRRCRPRPVRLQLGNRSQPRRARRPRIGLHVPAQDRQGLLCRMGFRRG